MALVPQFASGQEPTAGTEDAAAAPPWYSLFTDNRSDRFSKLRVERVELNRQVDGLQTDIRDLRLKNEGLDESIRSVQRQIVDLTSTMKDSNSSIEDLRRTLGRLNFEKQQRIDDMNADLESNKAELARIKTKAPADLTFDDKQRIADLEGRIADAPSALARWEKEMTFNIEELTKRIETEQAREDEVKAQNVAALDELKSSLLGFQQSVTTNGSTIVANSLKITSLYTRIDTIDAEILKLIDVGDTDGWFKIIISLSFALLVAGVIYGFYKVIGASPRIVNEIFSNDSGIQFVTIFSIVIAVILFGIIGVLEGKELSALLGGLSGYILGRNSAAPKVVTPLDDDEERLLREKAAAAAAERAATPATTTTVAGGTRPSPSTTATTAAPRTTTAAPMATTAAPMATTAAPATVATLTTAQAVG